MDYGKLAYMRLDELEQKVESKTATALKERNVSAFFMPCEYIESGKIFDLTYISGSGINTIIISIQADVLSVGAMAILLNGKVIAVNEIEKVGKYTNILFNSVKLTGESLLSIVCLDGLCMTLKLAQIALIGALADIVRDMSDTGVDFKGDLLGVLISRDGRLMFKETLLSKVDISGGVNIGFGKKCDLIAREGYFAAVYIDNYENLWGVILSKDAEISRKCLCKAEGFTSIAITKYDDTLIIGYSANGKANYFFTSDDFSLKSSDVLIETNVACDSVMFVKNSEFTALVYSGEGKSYMKIVNKEMACQETLTAKILVSVK